MKNNNGYMVRTVMQVTGVSGVHIMGYNIGEPTNQCLVSRQQAVDQDKFDRIWAKYRHGQKMEWE